MRKLVIGLLIAAMLMMEGAPAYAADAKTVGGALLVLTGGGLMIGAFEYGSRCPAGYSKHTFQGLTTQCVWLSASGSDVRDASTTISYERPRYMYAGIATMTTGIFLLMLPKKAQVVTKNLDIAIAPKGWSASKTLHW